MHQVCFDVLSKPIFFCSTALYSRFNYIVYPWYVLHRDIHGEGTSEDPRLTVLEILLFSSIAAVPKRASWVNRFKHIRRHLLHASQT